jgi:2-polyprenyl-3-methyl-5-hydroxy-6-metoxy-1,4-benzoquinol methylase
MRALDREIQRQRIARVLPFVPLGAFVLDLGCHDGAFFRAAGPRLAGGVGVDTRRPPRWVDGPFELRVGRFPDVIHPGERFNAVVSLAVVEHLPADELATWARAVPGLLRPGGRLVLTTPSPRVDTLLHALIALRLVDGMDAHEHHGFDPATVPGTFGMPQMTLEHRSRFQLGLNHLFVFRRDPDG